MALDRVKPLKLESIDTGGDEDDEFPTSLNPEEDHVECAGIVLDDPGVRDESTVIWRDGDDMKFMDTNNPDGYTLTELAASAGGGITAAQHDAIRQLIHFIDDGPGTGFASGAYKETTPAGPFPTSEIWWTSSGKTHKIVSLDTTWTGAKITQEVWKVYAADGVTVLATITDAIAYSGFFETSRTRTWSV